MKKKKIEYSPPNRPPTTKPKTDLYYKNYDKIFKKKRGNK